jgi:hypothetical protein
MTAEPDIVAELTPDLGAQAAIGLMLAAIAVLEAKDPRWRLSRAIVSGDLWLSGEAERSYRDAVRRLGFPELEPP